MKIILTAIACLTLVWSSYSQSESYAITLRGERLTGKIQILTSNNKSQYIKIKQGKEKKEYKTYQVKEVSIKGEIYRPLKIRNVYQLALLIKEGYMSYYKFSDSDASAQLSFSTPLLVKKDGTMHEVANLGFRKRLSKFLEDCKSIASKLDNKEYGKGDLNKIIDEYNACIKDKSEAIKQKIGVALAYNDKTPLIENIKNSIKTKGNFENKEELLEMLSDIQSKLQEGKSIPSFLKNAVRASLEKDKDLLYAFNKVIE